MISPSIILAGQLLGTAFACGLNLYATVALLGIAARAGWIPALPPGLAGLQSAVVIGSAAALYIAEFIIDRVPVADHVWEAVHTIIRPAAAAMLTILALHGLPLALQLAGGGAAAAMALAAHGSKAGLRLILATSASEARRRTLARTALSLLEDAAAFGIAFAALFHPDIAIGVVAASVVLMLLAGPRLWRAATLGLRAVVARTNGLFRGRTWRTREQLPRAVRAGVPAVPLGKTPPRATPAAVAGLPSVGAYRNGWLVFTPDGPRFLYRSLLRTRLAPIPHVGDVSVRPGLVTDTLDVSTNGNGTGRSRRFTIFLLKDGPPPHVTVAELTASP